MPFQSFGRDLAVGTACWKVYDVSILFSSGYKVISISSLLPLDSINYIWNLLTTVKKRKKEWTGRRLEEEERNLTVGRLSRERISCSDR